MSFLAAVRSHRAGRSVVVEFVIVPDVRKAIPLRRALQVHGDVVIVGDSRAGQADIFNGHVENRHEPLSRRARGKDWTSLIDRDAATKNLPFSNELNCRNNHFRRNEIGRTFFVVFAPPAPVAYFR
jgi:hypothetical protein